MLPSNHSPGECMTQSRLVLTLTAAAGLIDLSAILIVQGLLGTSPVTVLQAIASAFMGREAFASSALPCVLGVLLHFLVSLAFCAVYAYAMRLPWAQRVAPALRAVLLGAAAFAFMSYAVLPLTGALIPRPASAVMAAVSIASHILFFAVPIVYLHRRLTRADPR